MDINPGIVKVKTHLKSEFAQVLLANSITLTPGTVTVDIEGGYLFVHWLSIRSKHPHDAAEKIKGNFEKHLRQVFS